MIHATLYYYTEKDSSVHPNSKIISDKQVSLSVSGNASGSFDVVGRYGPRNKPAHGVAKYGENLPQTEAIRLFNQELQRKIKRGYGLTPPKLAK